MLALAQSRPMGRAQAAGQTYLNYVVPKKYGDANGFQPGSTFKVFVLAAAIKQGMPLTTQFASPWQVHIPMDQYRGVAASTSRAPTRGRRTTPPATAP